MDLYVQLMLFFICLNFGLGIAHIPDTPLSISDSQKATTGECLNDFYTQGLLTRVPATGVDANGNFAYVMSTYTSGANSGDPLLPNFNATAVEIHNGSVDGVFNVYDNILEPLDTLNAGVDTFINVMFGGYITNVLDTMTLECDTRQFIDPEETQPNPNYGQSMDSEVMVYFKTGINIIFGFMIFLLVTYLITGKDFGF